MKTSTGIMKYKSQIVRSNPEEVTKKQIVKSNPEEVTKKDNTKNCRFYI